MVKMALGGYAGYDTVIVEGKADKPVYLLIQDGQPRIKDVGHIWGNKCQK